jgi:hypothetical protein
MTSLLFRNLTPWTTNKAIYIALGVLPDSTKEILGIWIEQTEGAKFWLRVVNELKTRGAQDILVAVVDGLKGFPEAINAVFPQSVVRPADLTIGRIRRDATIIGPATAAICDLILEHRPHPEQGFRSCLGILRLARPFGVGRLEAAASRAIEIGALTFGSVRSILDHKLDRHAANQRPADGMPILHPNIRGARYYN